MKPWGYFPGIVALSIHFADSFNPEQTHLIAQAAP